jgi:hypothetical protein
MKTYVNVSDNVTMLSFFQTSRGHTTPDELQVLVVWPWLILPQVLPPSLGRQAHAGLRVLRSFFRDHKVRPEAKFKVSLRVSSFSAIHEVKEKSIKKHIAARNELASQIISPFLTTK